MLMWIGSAGGSSVSEHMQTSELVQINATDGRRKAEIVGVCSRKEQQGVACDQLPESIGWSRYMFQPKKTLASDGPKPAT